MTASVPADPRRPIHKSFNPEPRIAAIGAATVALYIANNWVMGFVVRNGAPSIANVVHLKWQAVAYVAVTTAIFVAYMAVLSMCKRGELHGRSRFWAFAVPCLLMILLIAWPPSLSEDVFSYLAHGSLALIPGSNPLIQPAEQAAHTAIGPGLAAYRWHGAIGVTPYGIIWTQIEVLVMKLCGTHVGAAMILMKSVVAAASVGTACCIWILLGIVRPSSQLFGTLAYLWNPLILVEFVAEGHNDAAMVFFVVAGLAACAAQRPTLSIIAQLFGFFTKYVPIIFFPPQLAYLWRTRRSVGHLVLHIMAALAVTGLVVAVLYAPLWVGGHSFDGLLRRGEPISSASPFGAINWVLRRSPLSENAGRLTLALVTVPLLVFVAWTSLRIKDAAGLARAFAWISVVYVLFAAPDYWPWYVCMPVALLIAADAEGMLWLVILMSFTSRLCAPLDVIRENGFLSMSMAKGGLTGIGTTLPLLVLVVWLIRQRQHLKTVFA